MSFPNDLPMVYGAYNNGALNTDSIGGPGDNLPIDVYPVDTYQVFNPLVIPQDYWADVDMTIRAERRTVTVPHERRTMRVR